MWTAVRNKLISAIFAARVGRLRAQRRLSGLVRPQVGALDHITIPVGDLALARRFYCDILGATYFMTVDDETFRRFGRPPAERGGEGSHHVSVYLGGRTRVDLFLQHSGQPPATVGHPHIAFHVPARRLLPWKAILEAHGIPVEGPLQLGPPGQASLYFNDPFGNHLEFTCLGYTKVIAVRPPVPERIVWDAAQLR
ncbi:MAG TPA: VOC family protein [Steroidobacteraceae bacterium]|jgi:catechol 2,3-dioxygenase-like lactoylglutathione lyase family enzyme